tara:strand:+ start:121 stop:789 length:669 start_codon:yes stop_codon:yes gene_type:complete
VKTLIILQARTNSKRLPGKVLEKIEGIPLVILCAKRLKNTKIPLIIAIPNDKKNIKLKKIIIKNRLKYSLGSHLNVFSRFKKIISQQKENSIIIRATADNPLPDGKFVNEMLSLFKKKKLDFLDSTKKNFVLPYGLAVQIFKVKIFNQVSKLKLSKSDKEHVVPKMSGLKKIKIFKSKYKKYKKFYTKKKLSIDNKDDLFVLRKIFSGTKKPTTESWINLIK